MSDHTHSINPYPPSQFGSHTHSFSSLPIYTDNSVPSGAMYSIGDRLFTDDATWTRMIETMAKYPQIPKQKEPEMTTLEKIRRERQEAREREKIEQMYTDYDEFDVDGLEDGIVLRFTWTPKDSEKSYEYAALKAAGRWYVTGRESPNGLAGEDFVAWLIGKDVAVADLIELVAA